MLTDLQVLEVQGDPAEDPTLLALGVGFLGDLPAGMSFSGFGGI